MGAIMPNAVALVSEYAPKRSRVLRSAAKRPTGKCSEVTHECA